MKQLRSIWLKFKLQLARWGLHWRRVRKGFPVEDNVLITPNLFVGGQFRGSQVKRFLDWEITGVISMRLHYPKSLDTQTSIEFLNLPTQDRHAPKLSDLKKGVAFIQKHIDQGGKVYVHCQLGEGRGPTMGAAYLISQGMTVADAIDMITQVRPFLNINQRQRSRLDQFAIEYDALE